MPTESTDRIVLADVPLRKPSSVNQSAVVCGISTLPRVCWDFELGLAVVWVVLAGLLILALLYRVLLLRHRLRVAQAGNALEYFGFYHMAHYDLKEPSLPVVTPSLPSPPPPVLHLTPPPPPPVLYVPPPHHPHHPTQPSPIMRSRLGCRGVLADRSPATLQTLQCESDAGDPV
ncbi:hypothetical protein R3I94_016370 [Phoxinus phoxinus]